MKLPALWKPSPQITTSRYNIAHRIRTDPSKPNAPSEPLRTISLLLSVRQRLTFPSPSGMTCYHRSKSALTTYYHTPPTTLSRHTLVFTAGPSTSQNILLRLSALACLYMINLLSVRLGLRMAYQDSTLVLHSNTTVHTAYGPQPPTTSESRTPSLGFRTLSPCTARQHTTCLYAPLTIYSRLCLNFLLQCLPCATRHSQHHCSSTALQPTYMTLPICIFLQLYLSSHLRTVNLHHLRTVDPRRTEGG